MREPLFPFYISDRVAAGYAKKDATFEHAVEREKYSNITSLEVSGRVTVDKKLVLWAHCSTDNGFCTTSGRIWKKTIDLTDAQFDSYVDSQLQYRAGVEIATEEELKLQERVAARMVSLRDELLR